MIDRYAKVMRLRLDSVEVGTQSLLQPVEIERTVELNGRSLDQL